MDDLELDAFGPLAHGRAVLLLPDVKDCRKLRSAYLEALRITRCPHRDTLSDPEELSGSFRVRSSFLSYGNRSVIDEPRGSEYTVPLISTFLSTPVVLVQPLGKARIWTYVVYRDGHMVDRFASCPEWLPEGESGDLEFREYERIHGRERAVRDYMRTWQGDPQLIGDLFEVRVSGYGSYLRQFTLAQLAEWGEQREKYADHKVRPEDRYSIASPWVFVHFIEHLGFPEFRHAYFDEESLMQRWGAAPVYSPAVYKRSAVPCEMPPCTREPFPFGGFFWNHEAICGKGF